MKINSIKFKKLYKKKGYNQNELAKHLNVTQAFISKCMKQEEIPDKYKPILKELGLIDSEYENILNEPMEGYNTTQNNDQFLREMIKEKDEKISELSKEVGRLEEIINRLKKEVPNVATYLNKSELG